MKYNINCIYNYYDTLLSQWIELNDTILRGEFLDSAGNFTEASGADNSNLRSRAKECFRVGLLTHELTKGMKALNSVRGDVNIQSKFGFIVALVYRAYNNHPSSGKLVRAIAAINAIFSIIQPLEIRNTVVSINTIVYRLLEFFPQPEGYDRGEWLRYLLSAFCCELKVAKDGEEIEKFVLGDKNKIALRIIGNKENDVRCSFTQVEDVKAAIQNRVSLTNIHHQKLPLFLIGTARDIVPRGFYGLADKYYNDFLYECYKTEIKDVINSPFKDLYIDDESPRCKKGEVLETIKSICSQNVSLANKYQAIMKSIEEGAIEALMYITDKPKSAFTIFKDQPEDDSNDSSMRSYLAAIRTKPFLLLAGISGTGKSRIVRKLAQMTVTEDLQRKYDKEYNGTDFENDRWNLHTPANFKLIQVKPNWHNSMDVVGYLTNIPEPHYVFTPFVEFIARAWQHQDVPFFLCLDEMNLAPVEEYFAEFLSAIESRAFEDRNGERVYVTDPIIKPFTDFGTFKDKDARIVNIGDAMVNTLFPEFKASDAGTPLGKIVEHFKQKGLTLPKNLIVIGTVNMDETTYSFSRKVLDRAMSFEMNEVDYEKFLKGTTDDELKSIREELKENLNELLTDREIEAKEVMGELGDAAKFVIDYLDQVNKLLNGTQFKLGYRAANEAMLYVKAAHDTKMGDVASAMNDFTLMKILSRFEGDSAKMRIDPKDKRLTELGYTPNEVKDKREESADRDTITLLSCMHKIVSDMLAPSPIINEDETEPNEGELDFAEEKQAKENGKKLSSLVKLESMIDQLNRERFVSYWN